MQQSNRWRSTAAFWLVVSAVISVSLVLSSVQARASSSKYAAIVVDARTGKVLHSENADSRRYPASLTKMMTLYLTFEALKSGRINKNSRLPFSAQAAAQPPTKLGVRAGNSITVEQAIYALITRSANDASMALAELLGGSQERFARMMTQKARSLGMRATVFRNPHGLPDTGQFTTARDMATLGIALREHFPQYYSYFSVRSFTYGRQRIANHNKLLGRVRGVDGIKTGYTRASGFNLVSSVNDGGRRVVAVVMGGQSGPARDNRMAQLIDAYLPKASRSGGGALVARSPEVGTPVVAGVALPKTDIPTPFGRPSGVAGGDQLAAMIQAHGSDQNLGLQAYADEPEAEGDTEPASASAVETGRWVIQVASSPSAKEARAILDRTKNAVGFLGSASAYTVPFKAEGTTYYRARFAGFSSQVEAAKACGALKRKKIPCYATLQD
ncbi:MAG: D-alanyl-D-alanine carboxypeptidase [Rhizobiaceae bacterium]|nr:D-alanyl-D-alanine carboxypeptidase [Rhizobiaceae bacterium]